MKKREKRLLEFFTDKYPPRGSWVVRHRGNLDGMEYVYEGYYSEKVRRCPVCGRYPVFTESAYHATPEGEKARIFLGYCPTCCLRTREPGTLKEAVYQWQRGEYSKDSLSVCRRPRFSEYGCRLLSQKIVEDAIEDAIFFAQKRQDITVPGRVPAGYGADLRQLEKFFRESVFMYELDPDGVISDIRRILYPTMKPKDRIKIPLHLDELYKGKEIMNECTRQRNSKKQH